MRTVEQKIYLFEELSEEAKQRVIDDYRYINVEYDDWWSDTYEMFKEECEDIGIDVTDIKFSGFASQGDGASFGGNIENIDKFLKHIGIDLLNNVSDLLTIEFVRDVWNYCHKYTCSTYVRFDDDIETKVLDDIEYKVEELRQELCDKLYKYLENSYDYLTSDEAIEEALVGTEYEFYEDGQRFY